MIAYYGTDVKPTPVIASAAKPEPKIEALPPTSGVCTSGTCESDVPNSNNIVTFITASVGTLPPLLWILLALILYVQNSVSRKLFETNAKLNLLLSVHAASKNVVIDDA